VPMLPERLSNNLCSLVPNEPRPAFTAIMEFDHRGKRTGKKFIRTIISSRHRLTYTNVKKLLADKDDSLATRYRDILPQLQDMADLAAVLESSRIARGSIGFSIPEAEVLIDAEKVIDVIRAERNMAHKLIEEFMLAANEAVAFTLAAERFPTLYRIHESPDEIKVQEFTAFARTLGLRISKTGTGSPKWFGKVLALVAGTPKEYIVSNILLRTMQRARYSPENVGHFGLAAEYYTHFTSPLYWPEREAGRLLRLQTCNRPGISSPAGKGPQWTLKGK
jgi:ribonuclease R